MITSSLVDSLKVLFSEDYKISDSDYRELSDILVLQGVSEIAFDSGLVQIIKLMCINNYTTPISLDFIRSKWAESGVQFNFVKMLVPLIRDGIIKIRKVSCEVFNRSDNITKSYEECTNNPEDVHVVIYASKPFKEVYAKFYEVISRSERVVKSDVISEGFEVVSSKIKGIIKNISKALEDVRIKVDLESYMEDDTLGSEEINIVCRNTSEYSLNDNELQRIANKFVKKVQFVISMEVYKESRNELYIGIVTKTQTGVKDYKNMVYMIHDFLYELEVNGVGED